MEHTTWVRFPPVTRVYLGWQSSGFWFLWFPFRFPGLPAIPGWINWQIGRLCPASSRFDTCSRSQVAAVKCIVHESLLSSEARSGRRPGSKGDRTPQEASMVLATQPRKISVHARHKLLAGDAWNWEKYLFA